jgi:hypothetical protein
MNEVILKDLPVDHPLRNKPLAGFFYYARGSKIAREVFPAFGIAKVCYNDLSDVWTKYDIFVWRQE